ncbi:MAG: DinB family protein [Deinococcota bacterium]|jgi:uncharacterized damage-inducible protein DinB|nr:DinB family protein [Deinococcota bacterium]
MERERLVLEPSAGYEAEIGLFLAALDDTRRRTKKSLSGLPDAAVDWTVAPNTNSTGTLLYHLAAIETDWLYSEILEQPFPEHVMALFPHDVRDEQGRLSVVAGVSLQEHLARLDATRAIFLAALQGMTPTDFYRVRHLPDYDVTPAWVLHHLMQHEAEHRGQLLTLRMMAERVFGKG